MTTTTKRDRIAEAIGKITQVDRGHLRPVALPAAAEAPPDRADTPEQAAAAPPELAPPKPSVQARERPGSTPGRIRVRPFTRQTPQRSAASSEQPPALETLPHAETVIRIPQSAAEVLAQLTGPEIRERYPIQRSVYLTRESLAMADELAERFARDRSAIVRISLAVLYALVNAPPSTQVDLFPLKPSVAAAGSTASTGSPAPRGRTDPEPEPLTAVGAGVAVQPRKPAAAD